MGLLGQASRRVVARAAGALHNLTCDAEAVMAVRASGGVEALAALLDADGLPTAIRASAAGALQNLAREPESRARMRGLGAVDPCD